MHRSFVPLRKTRWRDKARGRWRQCKDKQASPLQLRSGEALGYVQEFVHELMITVVISSRASLTRALTQENILEEIRSGLADFAGAPMRYRTAGTLSVVLIGGMFAIPAVIEAVFLPTLKHGTSSPLPGYEQIPLAVAAFCIGWRFVLAIPIALGLFTVAAFTSSSGASKAGPSTQIKSHPTNRPVGITVIAWLNILGACVLVLSGLLSAHQPEGGLAWMLAAVVVLSVCLGFALLRLQNWARAVVIVLYGLSLIQTIGSAVFAHGVDILAACASGLYLLWAIWYMHQDHVKACFHRA